VEFGIDNCVRVVLLSAWGFKYLQANGSHQTPKMRITDTINLGLREKILLLQVGKNSWY